MPSSSIWRSQLAAVRQTNGFRANTYVQEQGDNECHCSADVCGNESLSQTVHQYHENIGLEVLRNDINGAARSAYGGVARISD